jgi:hypothetical protein
MANKFEEIGAIYENENKTTGEKFLQISISKDVSLKKGTRVRLENPQDKFERMINSEKTTEAFKTKAREDSTKVNPSMRKRLIAVLEE